MLKAFGIFIGVVIVAAVALAALAYFRVIPVPGPILSLITGSRPPEHSARYYPHDTLVYAWISVAPSGGQLNNMMDIWERFNEYRAFEDLVEELKEEFASETGIDFDEDVLPWIGPDASVGLLDFDVRGETPIIVATVGVRDRDAADYFIDEWLEFMEDSEGADFSRDRHNGFDTWTDDSAQQAYALSDDLLVFATSADALEETLELADGDADRSLSADEDFQAARSALPGDRFLSVYAAARDAWDLAESMAMLRPLGAPMMGLGALNSLDIPDWVAASGGWVERGIVLEIVAPNVTETELEIPELEDPGRLLPSDTLAYLAVGFDHDLDRWREEMARYAMEDIVPFPGILPEINTALDQFARSQGISQPRLLPGDANLADALDAALWYSTELYGIDPEADFFDHLTGEFMLAVGEIDLEEAEFDPAANPVNAVAMLSYDTSSEDALRGTMEEATDLVEEHFPFIEADTERVGADQDAVVFPIEFTEYAPGYVLHDGYLTLGSTADAMEAIVERQNGDGDSLESLAEYTRAVGHLPGDRQAQGYVNLQTIFGQVESDDLDLERGEYRIIAESLGAVAFSSFYDDDESRATLALTLFPE